MPVRGKGFNQPVGISGSNQFGHSTTHRRTPLDAERRQSGGDVAIIEAREAAQQRLAAVGLPGFQPGPMLGYAGCFQRRDGGQRRFQYREAELFRRPFVEIDNIVFDTAQYYFTVDLGDDGYAPGQAAGNPDGGTSGGHVNDQALVPVYLHRYRFSQPGSSFHCPGAHGKDDGIGFYLTGS